MEKVNKKLNKRRLCTIILLITVLMVIRHYFNLSEAFYEPDYPLTDLSSLVRKENLSAADFRLIFKQTGVSPLAAKEYIKTGDYVFLEQLNKLYFNAPTFHKDYIVFPITAQETNSEQLTPLVDLKKGDILITFNTHTFDWRHGHCGIVLDDEGAFILEHMSVGETSCVTKAKQWGRYPAFAVLRHPDEKTAIKAAEYAYEKLLGIDYNVFAGIIKKDKSDQDKPDSSHCAHIVWQAYMAAGTDIDSNKGPIVLPKDIMNSQSLRAVQIFGINPDEYDLKTAE